MAGWLTGDGQADRVVPPSGFTAWLTLFTAGAMAFLAVFALALSLATGRLADRWDSALARTATVRISAPEGQMAAQTAAALRVLETTTGVASARALSDAEQAALLEPWFGPDLPVEHLPIPRLIEVVEDSGAELVVLARYMQILSDDLCRDLEGRVINIHHSFLPGFKGARPYHQAYDRGVKLIGATAHFVTADLDEGPIIEQDVERVEHHQTAEDLAQIGRDIERVVLARAVKLFAEDRVLLDGQRTVVFA